MLIPAYIIEELLKIEKERTENSMEELTIQRPDNGSQEQQKPDPDSEKGVGEVDFFI